MTKIKKLYYFANTRIPSSRANTIQILEMCQAFAKEGVVVELVVPRKKEKIENSKQKTEKKIQDKDRKLRKESRKPKTRRRRGGTDNPPQARWYREPAAGEAALTTTISNLYGFEPKFTIRKLPIIDLMPYEQRFKRLASLFYIIQEASFVVSSLRFLKAEGIIYTRSKWIAFIFSLFRADVVFEAHDRTPGKDWDRYFAHRFQLVVGITQTIVDSWQKLGAKVLLAPDAVSQRFFIKISQKQAREKLKLAKDKKIILYTGSFFEWKGVDTLLVAAKKMPEYQFYFVGNDQWPEHQARLAPYRKIKNIHFTGHQPYSSIPFWLKAADILVIPNSAKTQKGREDTSPLKLYEYLASNRPIVASKVDSITSVVSMKRATYFQPDSLSSLVNVLKNLKEKSEVNSKKVYSWENRVRDILDEI